MSNKYTNRWKNIKYKYNVKRGCVYNIQLHLVFCVKYRKEVIKGTLEKDLKDIFVDILESQEVVLKEFNSGLDHVHFLIEVSPQHNISNIVKALKGVSGRQIFKKHKKDLENQLWNGSFWNPSYFVSSVGHTKADDVALYIQNQKESGKRY